MAFAPYVASSTSVNSASSQQTLMPVSQAPAAAALMRLDAQITAEETSLATQERFQTPPPPSPTGSLSGRAQAYSPHSPSFRNVKTPPPAEKKDSYSPDSPSLAPSSYVRTPPPTKKKDSGFLTLSPDSPAASSSFKTPPPPKLKGGNDLNAKFLNISLDDDESEVESPNGVDKTPVSACIDLLNTSTPNHTLTPKSRSKADQAFRSIDERSPESQQEAYKRILSCTKSALGRSSLAKVLEFGEDQVVAVEDFKQAQACWPAEMHQAASQRSGNTDLENVIFDLSHILDLDPTEGGLSAKGKHVHPTYLPHACIHPRSKAWCAIQALEPKPGMLKTSKFSTFFPLSEDRETITALVSEAIQNGTIVAKKGNLHLIQTENCPFAIEIAIRANIVRTVFPVLELVRYNPDLVLTFDQFSQGDIQPCFHQISLQKVYQALQPKIHPKSEEIRFLCDNGDLIIDIAPFLKIAGYNCPIEKGLLVRFRRNEIFG